MTATWVVTPQTYADLNPGLDDQSLASTLYVFRSGTWNFGRFEIDGDGSKPSTVIIRTKAGENVVLGGRHGPGMTADQAKAWVEDKWKAWLKKVQLTEVAS